MRNKISWALGLILAATSCIYADGPATHPGIPLEPTTRSDGSTDYVAILNNACSPGVTTENNAAILLLPIFGTQKYPPEAFPILKSFGFEQLDAQPLESFGSYVRKNLPRDVNESDADFENRLLTIDKQTDAPWKAADVPVVATWLNENQKRIAIAVAASEKTRYYIPLIEKHPGDGLFSTLSTMPMAVEMSVQRALIKQAMLEYALGNLKDGQECLLAGHRLARLYAQTPILIDGLVAVAADRRTSFAERALLAQSVLDVEHQRSLLAALSALPAFRLDTRTFAIGELQFNLDLVQMLRSGNADEQLGFLGGIFNKVSLGHGDLDKCNWSQLEQIAREDASRWDALLKATDYSKRQTAVAEILKDSVTTDSPKSIFENAGVDTAANKVAIEAFLKKRPKETDADFTDRIGKWIFQSNAKITGRALALIDEAQVQACLTRTALALSLYKASQGHYPDALDALTPQYLPSVPQDWFSGKPLVYRRTGEAYILYSVGRNGIDDGGKDQNGDDGDIVVRSP